MKNRINKKLVVASSILCMCACGKKDDSIIKSDNQPTQAPLPIPPQEILPDSSLVNVAACMEKVRNIEQAARENISSGSLEIFSDDKSKNVNITVDEYNTTYISLNGNKSVKVNNGADNPKKICYTEDKVMLSGLGINNFKDSKMKPFDLVLPSESLVVVYAGNNLIYIELSDKCNVQILAADRVKNISFLNIEKKSQSKYSLTIIIDGVLKKVDVDCNEGSDIFISNKKDKFIIIQNNSGNESSLLEI